MPDTVLVTGATGLVGRALLPVLAAAGVEVRPHSSRDGDIAAGLPGAEGVGHVYHLAARTYVPDSWRTPAEFYRVNVQGTVSVLEFCRATGASLTLLSSYVYGQPQRLPIAEDHPVAAFNPYGHSKLLAEEAAQFYARQFGVRLAIVRPFNLYGPGQAEHFLIPSVVRQAALPECAAIRVEDLRPRRDYLHVRDLVELLLLLRGRTGVFNAGCGESVSVGELIELVNNLLPAPKPVMGGSTTRPVEVMDVVADISRARRETGWTPQTPLREGLRELLSLAQQNVS